jgi:uncharacterized membrane protein YhaH (DUF805 family)
MSDDQSNQLATALIGSSLVFLIISIVIFLFYIFIFWRICSKAGYSGALSLLNLIPGVGTLILLCILAFGSWPIRQAPMQNYGQPPFNNPQYPSGPNYPQNPQYRG